MGWGLHSKAMEFSKQTGWRVVFTYDPDDNEWSATWFDAGGTQRTQAWNKNWAIAFRAGFNLAQRVYNERWRQLEEGRPT